MLSGVPARACPAAIPHGGILVPLSTCSPALPLQQCGAPRTSRSSRLASELALQFTGVRTSQQPDHKDSPTRQLVIARAHECQPGGPQDDGYGCHGLGSSGIHQPQPQPPTHHQNPPHPPEAPSAALPPADSRAGTAQLSGSTLFRAVGMSGSAATGGRIPETCHDNNPRQDGGSGGQGLDQSGSSGSANNADGFGAAIAVEPAASPTRIEASDPSFFGTRIHDNCRRGGTGEEPSDGGGGATAAAAATPATAPGTPGPSTDASGSGLASNPNPNPSNRPLDPTSSSHPVAGSLGRLLGGSSRTQPSSSPQQQHHPYQRQKQDNQQQHDQHHQDWQQNQQRNKRNAGGEGDVKGETEGMEDHNPSNPPEQNNPSSPTEPPPLPHSRLLHDSPTTTHNGPPFSAGGSNPLGASTNPNLNPNVRLGLGPDLGHGIPPLPGFGAAAVPPLPPLRLGFLDWAKLQGGSASGSGSRTSSAGSAGSRSQSQRGGSGAARRRRSGLGSPEGSKSRSDRILQLVLAAKTLLQVRSVISRHLYDMSAATASVALSRLAGLSVATMRLRRAQQSRQQGGGVGEKEGWERDKQQTEAAVQGSSEDGGRGREGATAAAKAVAAEAEADSDAADVDLSARVQQGSLRLMRLLLRHIAMCVNTTAANTNNGGSANGSGAGATSPSGRGRGASPPSSSSPGASLPRPGSVQGISGRPVSPRFGGSGTGTSSSSSYISSSYLSALSGWRFQPPGRRAQVAGSVLVTLAQVSLKPGPSDLWALYRVVEAARPDLFLATPEQLSRIASSLPLLPPLRPSAVWLDHFASVSRSKMYAAKPGQLAAFAWCLARLGHNPGDLWLHSLTHHLSRDDNLRAATPGQLCQVLWALHRLDFSPDPDWRADCTAAVQAALTKAAAADSGGGAAAAAATGGTTPTVAGPSSSSSLSGWHQPLRRNGGGLSGAAASSRRRGALRKYDIMDEHDSEADELYDSSFSSVDDLEPSLEPVVGLRDGGGGGGGSGSSGGTAAAAVVVSRRYGSGYADVASLLLWAVRMGMAPGPVGMQACLDRLQPALRSLRRVHLLRLLLALSEAGYRPSEAFMARLLACLQPKLPLLGPTQLTQALLAISRLRFVPPQSWLVAFLKASKLQLRHYTPSHVAATYQVFADWQLRPSRTYLLSFHSLLDSLMPEFPPHGLAAVLQSMAALGVKPQHRWVARALEVLAAAAARSATGPTRLAHGSVSRQDAALGSDLLVAFLPAASGPPGAQGGYLPLPPPPPLGPTGLSLPMSYPSPPSSTGGAVVAAAGQQQQRAAAAAALVAAACSLRGIVQFDGERPSRAAATSAADSTASATIAAAAAEEEEGVRRGQQQQQQETNGGSGSNADVAADWAVTLLPYELWSSAKRVVDLCGELLDVMSGVELARLLTALSRINFYPGLAFLTAHARATARVGAQLAPADKEALAVCYSRLAALAPRMAEEARRQAEARQARTAVVVADPWVI